MIKTKCDKLNLNIYYTDDMKYRIIEERNGMVLIEFPLDFVKFNTTTRYDYEDIQLGHHYLYMGHYLTIELFENTIQ